MENLEEKETLWWEVVYKFIISVFTGLLLAGLIGLILQKTGVINDFLSPQDGDVYSLRWAIAINQLGTFIFPAIFFVLLIGKESFSSFFKLDSVPDPKWIVVATGAIIIGFIFVQYTYEWNQKWPIPEWMVKAEEDSQEKIKSLLSGVRIRDLMANLLIIAVLPAIGEELIFRGIIQKYLIKWIGNVTIGILIAGTIFSAIHFMFQGFVPRLLLGCLLGYYFWVSDSLWLPVIAHFFNNGFQVVVQYLFVQKMTNLDLESDVQIPWYFAIISLLATLLLCQLLFSWKKNKDKAQIFR